MSKIYWNNLDIELRQAIEKAVQNVLAPDGVTIVKDENGIISATNNMNGIVKSVNRIVPDEYGNVDTDFQIIDPVNMETSPTEYPQGNSEFVSVAKDFLPPSGQRQLKSLVDMASGDPERRIFVKTHVDHTSNIFLQEIDDNEDGYFEASYYRSSVDGVTWGELKKVKKIKTINGIEPDGNYNVQLPNSNEWGDF